MKPYTKWAQKSKGLDTFDGFPFGKPIKKERCFFPGGVFTIKERGWGRSQNFSDGAGPNWPNERRDAKLFFWTFFDKSRQK